MNHQPSALSAFGIIIIILFTFTQCKENKQTIKESPVESFKMQYTDTYEPPVFQEDLRVQKISALSAEIDAIFQTHAQEQHFPAYVYGIVVDDSPVFSGAYGVVNLDNQVEVNAQSLFKIASMTKSFTAMGIMKLKEEGKLDLYAPAQQYLPELENIEYLTQDASAISIHHLLTMTAGFPEDNPWGDRQLEDSDEEFMEFLRNGISMSNVPGEGFEYSNLGYAMLGNIITRVSGMPYQEYITKNIFQPLGMNDTYWEYEGLPEDQLALGYRWEDEQWKAEPMLHDGAFGAMGGLITSLDDFQKYVSFHLSAWPPSNDINDGPIKRNALRQMHKMTEPRLFTDASDSQGMPCPGMTGYAFGLGVRKDCHGDIRISHSGGLPGYGSEYQFYPEYGIGIISFANRTYAPAGAANNKVMGLLLEKGVLHKRELPVSAILKKRKAQVTELIQSWDEKLGAEMLAENFYLDQSKDHRMEASKKILAQLGNIQSVSEIRPINQLRGTFILDGEKNDAEVFFTLSPEKDPKVQAIYMEIVNQN